MPALSSSGIALGNRWRHLARARESNAPFPVTDRLCYAPQVLCDVGLRPKITAPDSLALRSGITIVYEVQLRRGDC